MTWSRYYEPFTAYRFRVLELCKVLGLGAPDEIEVVGYGSSHQIAGLNFASGIRWVLRTPVRLRYPEPVKGENGKYKITIGNDAQDTKDQVAGVMFAAQYFPVPSVIAYDSSENNPLRSRYIIQERVAGQLAKTIYDGKLSLSERLQIAECMAAIAKKFKTITFSQPGRIVADDSMPETALNPSTQTVKVEPFQLWRVKEPKFLPDKEKPGNMEYLLRYLLKFRESTYAGHWDDPYKNQLYQNLHKIVRQMGDAGYFDDVKRGKCVLWHWDLSAENVLIQKSDDGKWAVSGIIDWDEILSVPQVWASTPNSWLWIDERRGSYSWLGYKLDYNPWELAGEDLAVKLYYDYFAANNPHYQDDTYGKGKLIRRLAYFAVQDEFRQFPDEDDYKDLLKKWDDLCRKNKWGASACERDPAFKVEWSMTEPKPSEEWSDESSSGQSDDEESDDEESHDEDEVTCKNQGEEGSIILGETQEEEVAEVVEGSPNQSIHCQA